MPVVAGPFTAQLQSAKGIVSFTRLSAGQYVFVLEQPVSLQEAMVRVAPPPNTQVVGDGQVQSDGSVFVSVLSMASGLPIDPEFFYLDVFVFSQGEGVGPMKAAPAIPNALMPQSLSAPNNEGSIAVVVPAGATQIVVPAPPAGFVNVLHDLCLASSDEVDPVDVVVTDLGLGTVVNRMTLPINVNPSVYFLGNVVAQGALQLAAAGVSSGARLTGGYFRVPADKVIPWALVLTDTFAPVPSIIPSAGFCNRIFGTAAQPSGFPGFTGSFWGDNADSAPAQIEWRHTRGAVVTVYRELALIVGDREALNIAFPSLLTGDTLEFRTVGAPVVPGSVVVGGAVERCVAI